MSLGDGVLLGVAALLPVAFLALTCFVKISMVLTLLRSAFGTPEAPSSLILLGISLVLSAVVMAPVLHDMADAASAALAPPATPVPAPRPAPSAPGGAASSAGTAGAAAAPARGPGVAAIVAPVVTPSVAPIVAPVVTPIVAPVVAPASDPAGAPPDAWRALLPAGRQRELSAALAALGPLRAFARARAGQRELETFTALARSSARATVDGTELSVVAPAFIASELRRAFVMAIVLLLPFLVIDLVVGLALAALGVTSMSPQAVALPLKLLLFVAVDGWRLLVETLLRGYV